MTELKTGSIAGKKYRITEKLAEGGSGAVYLAEDTELEKLWALKAMESPEKLPQKSKYTDEIEILKALDHPLAPRLTDCFMHDGLLCLVMDYIDGRSVQKVIAEEGPVSPQKAAAWMSDICSLLDYLHANGIVYRDLKPSNMLLCHDGRIKLVDFGYPTKIVRDGNFSDAESYGTPGYAPSEQTRGYSDFRSDIYAAGVTLHQLLTAKPPSPKGFKLRQSDRKKMPPGLFSVIEKATQSDPAKRFSSMEEFIDALQSSDKIEKPYVEKLKLKIAVSKALLTAGLSLSVCGLLLTEAFYLKDLSAYRWLVEKDPDPGISKQQELLSASALMPQKPDACLALVSCCTEGGISEEEAALIDKVFTDYENSVFAKKGAYASVCCSVAEALGAGLDSVPFERCRERLGAALPYFVRATSDAESGAAARAFCTLAECSDAESLDIAASRRLAEAARLLQSSSDTLIGKGSAAALLARDEMIMELMTMHSESIKKCGLAESYLKEMASKALKDAENNASQDAETLKGSVSDFCRAYGIDPGGILQ